MDGKLPWWLSGKECSCQCRGHRFEPWPGKIPRPKPVRQQRLSQHYATTKADTPGALTPEQERPLQWEACSPQLEKACAQQGRPSTAINKFKKIFFKKKRQMEGQPPWPTFHSPKGPSNLSPASELLHTPSLSLWCFPLLFRYLAPPQPSGYHFISLHRELPHLLFISTSLGCSRFCYQVRLPLPWGSCLLKAP